MQSGRKQQQAKSRAMVIARTLVAAILAVSFFATIAPLNNSSANLMACCIGKPGHESGSCSTGLLEPARNSPPTPEVLCGQDAAPTAHPIETIDVETAVVDGGHCDLHPSSSVAVTSDSEKQAQAEPSSARSEKPELPGIHTLSSPCSGECSSCSVTFTWRPRPREQSTPSVPARPRWHLSRTVLRNVYPQTKTLNAKWVQLRPRAPPSRFS